jgi:GTP-binding protein Era
VPDYRFRCGMVPVVGRSNVGKSTLVNCLVGHKVSIISPKPQTTRTRVLGIRTHDRAQVIYIDTPGLHAGAGSLLSRYMNRAARGSLEGADCVLLVVAANGWTNEDDGVLAKLETQSAPVILVINKIDRLKNRNTLLPFMKQAAARMKFAEIIPVSAATGENMADLEETVTRYLPVQPALFPQHQTNDQGRRFTAAELVREQVFRSLKQEVPYAIAVGIENFRCTGKSLRVEAVIWVEKASQKGIIIGRGGERLKSIGTHAREEMERLFGTKVHLELWVKVREDWTNSETLLRSLQYADT